MVKIGDLLSWEVDCFKRSAFVQIVIWILLTSSTTIIFWAVESLLGIFDFDVSKFREWICDVFLMKRPWKYSRLFDPCNKKILHVKKIVGITYANCFIHERSELEWLKPSWEERSIWLCDSHTYWRKHNAGVVGLGYRQNRWPKLLQAWCDQCWDGPASLAGPESDRDVLCFHSWSPDEFVGLLFRNAN